MKIRKIAFAAASLTVFLNSGAAHAEFKGLGEQDGWLLGLGLISDFPAYEGTDSPEILPVPYIAYSWENATLGVEGFTYNFFGTDTFEVTALIEPRWSFTDPNDSSKFNGIERDTALEAGLAANLNLGNLYLEGRAVQDVSAVHKGREGTLKAGFIHGFGDIGFDLGVGATYRNDDLNLHLYGVKSDEVTPTLAQFTPDDSVQPFIEGSLAMPISDSISVIAFGKVEKFSDDIKSSPLVSRSAEGTAGVLFLKRF